MWPGEQQGGGQPQYPGPGGGPAGQPQHGDGWYGDSQYGAGPYGGGQQAGGPYGSGQQEAGPYGQPHYGQPQYGASQGPWPGGPQGPSQPHPPQWGGPGGPRKGSNGAVVAACVAGAALLLGGAAFTAVTVMGGDGESGAGQSAATASAPAQPPGSAGGASAEPSQSSAPATDPGGDSPGGDDGLSGPDNDPSKKVKAAVPGWRPVPRKERGIAYDVPRSWSVESEGTLLGFENSDGTPKVLMGGAARHKKDWCGTDERAVTGTKGATGAKSTADAARTAAASWARAAYTDEFGGTVRVGGTVSFTNKHGLKGSMVTATVTGTSEAKDKCASDGLVRAVAVKDSDGEYAVWIVVADTGVEDAVTAREIETMTGSLRFMKAS